MKPSGRLLLLVLFALGTPAIAESVLIINSYHAGFEWSDGMVEGIRDGLNESGRATDISVEYLDTKRRPYDQSSPEIQAFAQLLRTKYGTSGLSLIITTDDNALSFCDDIAASLYPGVPVVFGGVNHLSLHDVEKNSLITGIVESDNHDATFRLIRSLHPQVRTVYAITDSTTSGQGNETKLEEAALRWRDELSVEFLTHGSDATLEQLLLRLRELPDDSVVLYRDYFVDTQGEYLEPARVMQLVSTASPVPVYSFGGMYLGHGVTGGIITRSYDHGLRVAAVARRVLDGVPPSSIPIREDGVARPVFDYAELRKHQIPLNNLPPDSEVIGQPRSLYHDYTTSFWLIIVSILGLTTVVAVLAVSVRRLRQVRLENSSARNFLQATLESMGEGLITVDPAGLITDMNTAAERLFAIPSSDVTGRSLSTIVSLHGGECDGDIECLLDQIVQQSQPLHCGDDEYLAPRDGSGRRLSYSGSPLEGEEGALGIVLTVRDVTREQLMLAELEQSETRLVRSQAVANVGSWEFDPDTRRIWGSAEFYRILGVETEDSSIGAGLVSGSIAQEDRKAIFSAIRVAVVRGEPFDRDVRIVRSSDHEVRFIQVRGERSLSDRTVVLGTIQDITQSKITRAQLEESLGEKEVLLREVHHRVKNNMQVISSMINLQQSNAEGKSLGDALMDSQNRIRSMALIHEMLYQSKTFTEIDLEPYLRSLSVTLFDAYSFGAAGVRLEFRTESVSVDLDRAIPCGLMANEIISNSLKYAFDGRDTGLIQVSLKQTGTTVALSIRDDGIGIPEDCVPSKSRSLGLQLITTLAEQLGATLDLDRSEGTMWHLEFAT